MDRLDSFFASISDPATGEDDAWTAVFELQKAATRTVLERTVKLTTIADGRVRARAASVLGQLGIPTRTFPDECLHVLIGMLGAERDEHVIDAAICAIGHLDDARGVAPVLRFVMHDNEEIRFATAFALGGRSEPEAIAALIALTKDSAAKVRDWATFGIGALADADTPEIRDALFDRLHDADSDTRFEAMCGLAHHRDNRAVEALIDHLNDTPTDDAALRAASELLGWEELRAENAPLSEVLECLERLR